MQAKEIVQRLRQFDAYPKTLEDFRIKTFGGATVTIISGILMFILFFSELNFYLTTEVQPELLVDISRGQKIRINLDITFPGLPCAFVSLDAMDVSGEQQNEVDHNVLKQRLDKDGVKLDEEVIKQELGTPKVNETEANEVLDPSRCESCYGAETATRKCCNTCDEVKKAYNLKGWAFTGAEKIEQCKREGYSEKIQMQQNEGCRLYGFLEVNKVAGNFHFAPGKSFQSNHVHVHDLQSIESLEYNLTHSIQHLSFGQDYPGIQNPLDSTYEVAEHKSMMFQYFIKVVPTTYMKMAGEPLYTNQYSVTKHNKNVGMGILGNGGLPGVFFSYELSPMMVKYTEKKKSFMHFLTGVCAIIGGIFTVAGLVDSFIYRSSQAIQKKIEMGKAS